ncbi:MAG: hypothetical protein WC002_08055 [Candidatus Muiribacteriota bacterium]
MKNNSKFTECHSSLKRNNNVKNDKVIVNHTVFEIMFSNMQNRILCEPDKKIIK